MSRTARRHQARQRRRRIWLAVGAVVLLVALVAAIPLVTGAAKAPDTNSPEAVSTSPTPPAGIGDPAKHPGLEKIDHVIFIVQENRSFDHYFGMYPGADGIPRNEDGSFPDSTCNPHPVLEGCFKPYHTTNDVQIGGPHEHKSSTTARNGGEMNGFIQAAAGSPNTRKCVLEPDLNLCKPYQGPDGQPDVMSYRVGKDIPNYWALADWGVLQDNFFSSVDSYTLPAHLFIFSGWSATCPTGPMSCKSDLSPDFRKEFKWTPIPFLLDLHDVSWAWYVGEDTTITETCYPECPQQPGDDFSPPNWNPPPGFTYIKDHPEYSVSSHVKSVENFRKALAKCETPDCPEVPSVSWIIPAERVSEHPGKGSMRPGYDYVSKLVRDIGASPLWDSVAVFIFWDDWGGFYDHKPPVKIDGLGYGIRVPGLMVSPYAKEGYIDSQLLSFDAMLKFIEDRFLEGQRLDPVQPYMPPDNRPSVREEEAKLGDLYEEFDFTQSPRPAPELPD